MTLIYRALKIIALSFIIVVWFVFCYTPINSKHVEPDSVIEQGFTIAQHCYPSSMKLEMISLNVIPGKNFFVFGNNDIGFSLFRRVYVAEAKRNDPTLWAHEFIHSFGVIGHPKKIFERCNLL